MYTYETKELKCINIIFFFFKFYFYRFISFIRLLRKRDSFHLANAEGEIEVLECSFDSASLEEAVKVTVL